MQTFASPQPAEAFLREAAAHTKPNVSSLDIGAIGIGEKGWALLTEAVSKGNLPDLLMLTAWKTDLSAGGCEAFGAALTQSNVRLAILDVGGNRLGPSGLDGLLPAIESGALNDLKTLLADECGLRELPFPLCLLPKLRRLDVRGNDLRSPPQSIFFNSEQDADDKRAAAARRFAEGALRVSVRGDQFKSTVLGRYEAGKTSLLGALANGAGEPSLTRGEDRTLAVANKAWTHQLHSGWYFGREDVTVLFWDHGGQEDYDAIHHLFWTPNALVLLVWDVNRNAEDEMESDVLDWLRQLQAAVPGAVVQIVATQADRLPTGDGFFRGRGYAEELAQPHIDRLMARVRALQQELAAAQPLHILDALLTSARRMTGLAELQQAMVAASELEQFEYLRTPVPQAYVNVRSCLLRARTQEGPLDAALTMGGVDPEAPVVRPHAPYSQTRELVPHVSPETFDDAVRWLCALGVLQVQGDLLLLDPAWLGDVLRPLVVHDLLQRWPREELQPLAARGLLTPQALDFLWGADEFTADDQRARAHVPEEQRGDALDLLQKAGAVTRVPHSPVEQFFVSARLPVDAPDGVAEEWPAALPHPTANNLGIVEVARKLVLRSNRFPAGFPQTAMAACAVRATTLHGWRTGFLCAIDALQVHVDVGATDLRLAVRTPLASLASGWAALEVAQDRIEKSMAAWFPGLEYGVHLQCGLCLLRRRELPLLLPTDDAACTQCAPTIPGLLVPCVDVGTTAAQLGEAFRSDLSPLVATEQPIPAALLAELAALREEQVARKALVRAELLLGAGEDAAHAADEGEPALQVATPPIYAPLATSPDAVRIGKLLGRGAFGVVHRGRFQGTDVAVKYLPPPRAADVSHLRRMLRREARAMCTVRHSNIVSLFAYCDQAPDNVFLVMELAEGGSLDRLLDARGSGLSLARRFHILRDVAAGMLALHAKGVVHCDLKPDNVLISSSSSLQAKVADFGLARVAAASSSSMASVAAVGHRAGTPMYKAPEVFPRADESDDDDDNTDEFASCSPASDVFSFGMLAYELVTRRQPWLKNGAPMHADQIRRRLHADPPQRPPMDDVDSDFFRGLIERCWAQDPAERPSFDTVHAELEASAATFPLDDADDNATLRALRELQMGQVLIRAALAAGPAAGAEL